jgi:hypothetical protein
MNNEWETLPTLKCVCLQLNKGVKEEWTSLVANEESSEGAYTSSR